jgi:Xaa-Pro aminopeptidase
VILLLGNDESPMNYPANTYHFRQDSSFLYFFGLDTPGLAAIIDPESGKDTVYGDDISLEDIIWMGYLPSVKERALKAGVKNTASLADLGSALAEASQKGRKIHFLPPYRVEIAAKIEKLAGIPAQETKEKSSVELIQAIVAQRSCKIPEEVAEIEKALATTYKMYITAMQMAQPGIYEREIAGRIDGLALAGGAATAFPTILTINGQILHNHSHGNQLRKGNLLVVDAGAETEMHYASDITRTIPVGGKFLPQQKEIYEIVLRAQETAIRLIRPGIKYREVHLEAAKVIASGLADAGLIKGDVEEAVKAGAHALFFPHGLGHMLGLDVHDMENLGENYVGYTKDLKRSDQFGLAYLRLARELEPGFVVTVEPGIYFIPALIDKWQKEKKFTSFIAYDKVEKYRNFGGIRIEDNVLVIEKGHRVLGRPIPKKVADLQKTVCGRS